MKGWEARIGIARSICLFSAVPAGGQSPCRQPTRARSARFPDEEAEARPDGQGEVGLHASTSMLPSGGVFVPPVYRRRHLRLPPRRVSREKGTVKACASCGAREAIGGKCAYCGNDRPDAMPVIAFMSSGKHRALQAQMMQNMILPGQVIEYCPRRVSLLQGLFGGWL